MESIIGNILKMVTLLSPGVSLLWGKQSLLRKHCIMTLNAEGLVTASSDKTVTSRSLPRRSAVLVRGWGGGLRPFGEGSTPTRAHNSPESFATPVDPESRLFPHKIVSHVSASFESFGLSPTLGYLALWRSGSLRPLRGRAALRRGHACSRRILLLLAHFSAPARSLRMLHVCLWTPVTCAVPPRCYLASLLLGPVSSTTSHRRFSWSWSLTSVTAPDTRHWCLPPPPTGPATPERAPLLGLLEGRAGRPVRLAHACVSHAQRERRRLRLRVHTL